MKQDGNGEYRKLASGLPYLRDPLTRRRFLATTGAAVAAAGIATLSAGPAAAAKQYEGRKVVFVSWGGLYQDAQKVAICDPFAEKSGATVIQDGPVNSAKFLAMVQSGDPTWDVVDVTDGMLENTAKDGFLEKIDTSIVDVSRITPAYVHEYGVGDIVWCYLIGYGTRDFNADNHPKSWADVFDLKSFPGKRTFPAGVMPNLELALMADGVAPKDLYPLDVDRAFAKMDTIKNSIIFWESNSQSQQLFIDGEVACGVINNARARDAINKGGKLAVEWNQNLQSVDYLVVPKGAKNRDVAMALINEMTTAESQAKVSNLLATSPTNPAALPDVNKDLQPWMCTSPENEAKGSLLNAAYWRDNLAELSQRWELWKLT